MESRGEALAATGTPTRWDSALMTGRPRRSPLPAECMVPDADMGTCLDAINKAMAEREASTLTTREH